MLNQCTFELEKTRTENSKKIPLNVFVKSDPDLNGVMTLS